MTRIFTSEVSLILDFHGTGVTPGHVYWCASGRLAGEFAPLIDILRTDGAVADTDGNQLRAATKQPVGGAMDRPVRVVAVGGAQGVETGTVRTGTRIPEGAGWVTVDALIARAGGTLAEDGLVQVPGAAEAAPFMLPTDHVPKRAAPPPIIEFFHGAAFVRVGQFKNGASPAAHMKAIRHLWSDFSVS